MQVFRSICSVFQRISKKQLAVASAFVIALVAAVGLGMTVKQYTSAISREWDDNAILRGGALSPAELANAVTANDSRQPASPHDLQAIYSAYDLNPGEYDRFAQTAQMAKVYRNGNVVMDADGSVVMTSAWSLGRQSWGKSCRKPISIAGRTYYTSPTDCSFAASTQYIPAMVMFNDNGVAEAVIMTSCGNPTTGNRVTPAFECKMLNKYDTGIANTYDFNTNVYFANNARFVSVTYNFDDGSKAVVSTNAAEKIRHTFTVPGTHTVTVTVTFALPGGKTRTGITSIDCKKQVTVLAPYAACDRLIKTAVDAKKRQYSFTLTGTAKNGAVLKSGNFIYDGKKVSGVKPNASGQMVNVHTFDDYEAHTIIGEVNFDVNGQPVTKTAPSCQIQIPAVPKPFAACNRLIKTTVDVKKRTYDFTVTGTAKNGAVVKSANFIYDSKTKVSGVKPGADGEMTNRHTFNDYAAHKIVAEVTFDMNGDGDVTKTAPACQLTIPATSAPYAACEALKAAVIDADKRTYRFTLTGEAQHGPVVKSGDFSYDGAVVVSGVKPNASGVMTDTHTFADNNEHKVIGTVHFDVDGKDTPKTATTCEVVIPAKEVPTPPEQPAPPEEVGKGPLPNTGPGGVFGIFTGFSALGAVAHRVFTRRRQ